MHAWHIRMQYMHAYIMHAYMYVCMHVRMYVCMYILYCTVHATNLRLMVGLVLYATLSGVANGSTALALTVWERPESALQANNRVNTIHPVHTLHLRWTM